VKYGLHTVKGVPEGRGITQIPPDDLEVFSYQGAVILPGHDHGPRRYFFPNQIKRKIAAHKTGGTGDQNMP